MATEVPDRPAADVTPPATPASSSQAHLADKARMEAYWRENLRLIAILTLIWFLAAYAHPPFAKALNNITILTGFPLGYWLSSQFSLTVFVILIFVYALVMNKVIDPKYRLQEEE